MNARRHIELLSALHRGLTSRNRDPERFQKGEDRQVYRGHRRLRGLIRDLSLPGVKVGARWLQNPGGLAVAVDAPSLRYRRVVFLSPWEAEFFLGLGPGAGLPELPPDLVSPS